MNKEQIIQEPIDLTTMSFDDIIRHKDFVSIKTTEYRIGMPTIISILMNSILKEGKYYTHQNKQVADNKYYFSKII